MGLQVTFFMRVCIKIESSKTIIILTVILASVAGSIKAVAVGDGVEIDQKPSAEMVVRLREFGGRNCVVIGFERLPGKHSVLRSA